MAKKKLTKKVALKKKLPPVKAAIQDVTPPVAAPAPGAFVDKFIDHESFFSSVRDSFGPLRQLQVDGFISILKAWTASKLTNLEWLAYMLATTWHETAATMHPITEYGSAAYLRKKKYWPFIGRGYVQLTWLANYKKYGIDKTPEKALEPDFAAHVMIDGMTKGIFTGKRLDQYFNDKKSDPVGARRIINGTDRAAMIAGHYNKFLLALKADTNEIKSLT